jgi:hypothetical protein
MKQTQSALALLLAIIIAFGAIVLVSGPVNQWIMAQPHAAEWISVATYGLILVLFFTVYGIVQNQLAKKQAEAETALLTFTTVPFKPMDAAGGILVILLILILPALQLRSLSLARLVMTLVCLLAYLGLVRASQKNLRIHLTRHRIMIVGFDARLKIPDPNGRFAYANPSGFLTYDRLAGFELSETMATLHLRDETAAPIFIPLEGEAARQFQGLMAMHRIQRWYPQAP